MAGLMLNLLVIPSVAVVLVSGLAGMLVGCFWMTGAKILIFPGKFLLWLYEMLCGAAGSLSIGNLRIPVTWVAGQPKLWQIVLYYLILGTLLFLYSKKGKWRTGYKEKYEEMPLRMIKISGIVYQAILAAGGVVGLPGDPSLALSLPADHLSGCGAGRWNCDPDAGRERLT